MHITSIRAALLTFSLLALAACGVSDELPVAAVSSRTAAVLRVSTTGFSSESLRQSTASFTARLAKSSIPQLAAGADALTQQSSDLDPATNDDMKQLDDSMSSLRAIGAKAICLIADDSAMGSMPDSYSAQSLAQPGVMILVQTTSTGSADDVQAVISKLFESSVVVEHLGKGWYWIKAQPTQTLPSVPDLVGAQQLQSALTALPPATIAFAMRVTPEVKTACEQAFEADDSGMMMFFGSLVEPLRDLTALSGTVEFGPKPTVRAAMRFGKNESAAAFNSAWATTTKSVFSMVGMMAAGGGKKGEPKVDPKTFSNMATALAMTQNESTLMMTLDDGAWAKLIP